MKVNLDDPNLTAFALGELSPDDHARMAKAIADSREAQSYVAETQQFARVLRAEYEADRQEPARRSPIAVRMEEERRSSSRYQWGSLAAAFAIFAVLGALAISTIKRSSVLGVADGSKPSAPKENSSIVEAVPEPSVEMQVAQQSIEEPPPRAPPEKDELR